MFNVYNSSKFCPTLLHNLSLPRPNRNLRDFTLSNVDYNRRNYPVAKCALAANAVSTDSGMFSGRFVVIGDFLTVY